MNGILKGFNGLRIPHCHFLLIHGYPLSAFVLNNGCSSDNWQCHRDRSDTSYPRPAGALWYLDISIIDEGQICSTAGLKSTTLISQYLSKNEKEHPHAHHASTTSYYYWLLGFAVQQFHMEKQAEKTENKTLGGLLTIFSWHEMWRVFAWLV